MEELQLEFKNVIEESIKYLENFSMYEVLAVFYWEYKISFGIEEERDERWFKSLKIMYLQLLFLCSDKNNKKIELDESNKNKIDEYIKKIHNITIKYGSIFNKDNELKEEEKEYLNHSYSFKDWSGKRYDIFEIQHHKDLLGCLGENFAQTYGFSLEKLYSGILNLKNNFYFKFENSCNKLRELMRTKKIIIDKEGIHEGKELNEKERQLLEEYVEDVNSLELANLNHNTEWTREFLDIFLVEEEEYKKFTSNITIENWNDLTNKIKYKPFIKIEDKYYILLQQKFYDNFDKIALQGMCKKIPNKEQQELREIYTSNIENVVANYFRRILEIWKLYAGISN